MFIHKSEFVKYWFLFLCQSCVLRFNDIFVFDSRDTTVGIIYKHEYVRFYETNV